MAHSDDINQYLDVVLGTTTSGYLCVGIGIEPFRDSAGKYKHQNWLEHAYSWPADAEDAITEITDAASLGDVYVCPYLMRGPRRTKGDAVQRALLHADVDAVVDEEKVSALGGFTVASGTRGHGHVYVPLAWPVMPDQHEALCRGLAAHLDGDTKYSDNDLLRPPGSFNHKAAVDGGTSTPVTTTWNGVQRADPREVAQILGVDLANPNPGTNGNGLALRPRSGAAVTAGAAVNLDDYPSVQAALAQVTTGDRSADTYRIVVACRRAGLTLGEATFVVRTRDDLRERIDARTDDDLLAIWLKLEDEERTLRRAEPQSTPTASGAELLDAVHAALTKYVVFPKESAAVAVALWVVATHALPAWQHATRLVIRSPQKRCGKSRLLDIVRLLSFSPMAATDMSTAVIYRSIGDSDHRTPTLLVDEADALFGTKTKAEQHEDLRGLFNAGFQRDRTVWRCSGPQQTPTEYQTFSMVALAAIKGLPDTIVDRAVVIDLKRRGAGETVERFRMRRDTKPLLELRKQLTAWARSGERLTVLGDAEPEMPDSVEDRQQDAWEPLLAVANEAGGHWPALARAACLELCQSAADADEGVLLLADINQIFESISDTFIGSQMLVNELCAIEESPWGNPEKKLTTHRLASKLKDFGIRPDHNTAKTMRGYDKAWLRDAWDRYLS